MSILERLLLSRRLLPQQIIRLEADLFLWLDKLAASQGKTVQTYALEVLEAAVYENNSQTKIDSQWETLTPRERQVAALTCLGYKNSEIAHRLTISINTVRSHTRSILEKYQVSSKAELRLLLAKWDFETWLASQPPLTSLTNPPSPPGTSAMS